MDEYQSDKFDFKFDKLLDEVRQLRSRQKDLEETMTKLRATPAGLLQVSATATR